MQTTPKGGSRNESAISYKSQHQPAKQTKHNAKLRKHIHGKIGFSRGVRRLPEIIIPPQRPTKKDPQTRTQTGSPITGNLPNREPTMRNRDTNNRHNQLKSQPSAPGSKLHTPNSKLQTPREPTHSALRANPSTQTLPRRATYHPARRKRPNRASRILQSPSVRFGHRS